MQAELVGPRAARQDVAAAPAVQDVRARAADELVRAEAADELVAGIVRGQRVVAVAADHRLDQRARRDGDRLAVDGADPGEQVQHHVAADRRRIDGGGARGVGDLRALGRGVLHELVGEDEDAVVGDGRAIGLQRRLGQRAGVRGGRVGDAQAPGPVGILAAELARHQLPARGDGCGPAVPVSRLETVPVGEIRSTMRWPP